MKKKILFFLFSLSGGGAERTVLNIINNLDRDKYESVLVLGTDKNNDYIGLLNKNTRVKFLNCSRLRYCILKLSRCIKQESPDLLFSTINANNIILLLASMFSFRRIPIVIREANNRTQSGSVTFINKITTNILYNVFSDKIIALSKGVKKDLESNFLINESKIKVIYNPVEVKKIQELSKEKVEEFYKADDEKLVISVGRLVEQKDHSTLIKAFSILEKKIKSKLIILGKGSKENELKMLCKKLGVEKNVLFLGFKDNPYKFMRHADLFVLSSQWEGFGHVIVEAMAVGTPVISTDCNSGPREIIKNNQYGVLVPVADVQKMASQMTELLLNEELCKHYSEMGRKRSNDFDTASVTKQYEKVFNMF